MFKKFFTGGCSLLLLLFSCPANAQNDPAGKKLIEFGWDYPTISYLQKNINDMEATPFDGVCFSLDGEIYNAFDTAGYKLSKFQYDAVKKIQWKKFTDNFLLVRGASYAGAHWLDDRSWGKIVENLEKLSASLSVPNVKGIGFDPEYYFKDSTLNPWVYKSSYYNGMSYEEVGTYVRRRGKQFIQALQTHKADVKILCFWLLGLTYVQSELRPIEQTQMALYPFFVEGMLEGKNDQSEIIDGNEASYTYQSFVPFAMVGQVIREKQGKLLRESLREKFKNISVAQAVYLDLLYAKRPQFEKGFDKQTQEQWLRDNLYFAFKTTDKYVWFYNEKVNWWKNDIDPGLKEIIKEVKARIVDDRKGRRGQFSGNGATRNFRDRKTNPALSFSYDYSLKNNSLKVLLRKDDVRVLQVYENSKLIYTLDHPPMTNNLSLAGKYSMRGNLVIMAKDSKGVYSIAFVN